MATRYETFNEVTFEAYVKAAIDKSILKERLKKAERSKWEVPLYKLTDAILYELSHENTEMDLAEISPYIFHVWGNVIQVFNERLGQALSILVPRDREIILSYFFLQARAEDIAHKMNIAPTTVRRRYKKAIQKLHNFLEDTR